MLEKPFNFIFNNWDFKDKMFRVSEAKAVGLISGFHDTETSTVEVYSCVNNREV